MLLLPVDWILHHMIEDLCLLTTLNWSSQGLKFACVGRFECLRLKPLKLISHMFQRGHFNNTARSQNRVALLPLKVMVAAVKPILHLVA